MSPKNLLLGLPLELRRMVYRHVLVKEPNDPERPGYVYSLAPPALLKVNRQIREEALPLFYGENFFFVNLQTPMNSYALVDWLATEPYEDQTNVPSESQPAEEEAGGPAANETWERSPQVARWHPFKNVLENTLKQMDKESYEYMWAVDPFRYWWEVGSTLGMHFKHINRLWLAHVDCEIPERPDYEIGLHIIDAQRSRYPIKLEPSAKSYSNSHLNIHDEDGNKFCAQIQTLFDSDLGWLFDGYQSEGDKFLLWWAMYALLSDCGTDSKAYTLYWAHLNYPDSESDDDHDQSSDFDLSSSSSDLHDSWHRNSSHNQTYNDGSDNDSAWMYDDCASDDFAGDNFDTDD